MYKIKLTIHNNMDQSLVVGPYDWHTAIHVALGMSLVTAHVWTRKHGIGLLRHLDIYFDLYNEGAIEIIKL
jgi:hypothetical protein